METIDKKEMDKRFIKLQNYLIKKYPNINNDLIILYANKIKSNWYIEYDISNIEIWFYYIVVEFCLTNKAK